MPRFASKKFVIAFLAIIAVVAGGYFIWDRYFSAVEKARRFLTEQYDNYKQAESKYVAAATADTYGSTTPQGTLDMFVAALRTGDVELASKYFLLDENASRDKWVARLTKIKNDGYLDDMANDIEGFSKPVKGYLKDDPHTFAFVIYDENGIVGAQFDMRLNTYSSVWKIESF